MMVDKRFGEHVKRRRGELGLTQEQFAEKVGLSTAYISALEQGKSFPSYQRLILIINGLETSADHLFGELLDYSCASRATEIYERLSAIPVESQKCILAIMDAMINLAEEYYQTIEKKNVR